MTVSMKHCNLSNGVIPLNISRMFCCISPDLSRKRRSFWEHNREKEIDIFIVLFILYAAHVTVGFCLLIFFLLLDGYILPLLLDLLSAASARHLNFSDGIKNPPGPYQQLFKLPARERTSWRYVKKNNPTITRSPVPPPFLTHTFYEKRLGMKLTPSDFAIGGLKLFSTNGRVAS